MWLYLSITTTYSLIEVFQSLVQRGVYESCRSTGMEEGKLFVLKPEKWERIIKIC